jgi:hypothetical protein
MNARPTVADMLPGMGGGSRGPRPQAQCTILTYYGQHVLFVRLHHPEPPDFPKITGEAGFGRHAPIKRGARYRYYVTQSLLQKRDNEAGRVSRVSRRCR